MYISRYVLNRIKFHKFFPGSSTGGSIADIIAKGIVIHALSCDFEFIMKHKEIQNYDIDYTYTLQTSPYDFSQYFLIYIEFKNEIEAAEWMLANA